MNGYCIVGIILVVISGLVWWVNRQMTKAVDNLGEIFKIIYKIKD